QLLKVPVQRGHIDYDYPFSFELLILAIRNADAATGCPADVRNFVLEHLSTGPGLAHLSSELVSLLYESLDNPLKYYRCPSCTAEVIV
ncbi:hypothetical protein TRAPUB_5786, partial [Trametes pubescens]